MSAGLDPLALALAAVDGNECARPELVALLYGPFAAAARAFFADYSGEMIEGAAQ